MLLEEVLRLLEPIVMFLIKIGVLLTGANEYWVATLWLIARLSFETAYWMLRQYASRNNNENP